MLPYGTSVLPFSLGELDDLIGRSADWLKFDSGGRAVPRPIAAVEVLRVITQPVEQQRRDPRSDATRRPRKEPDSHRRA